LATAKIATFARIVAAIADRGDGRDRRKLEEKRGVVPTDNLIGRIDLHRYDAIALGWCHPNDLALAIENPLDQLILTVIFKSSS
jgi:hypothetical protein